MLALAAIAVGSGSALARAEEPPTTARAAAAKDDAAKAAEVARTAAAPTDEAVLAAAPMKTAAADQQLAIEDENMAKLHGVYNLTSSIVGKQHTLVSPVILAGRRCATGENVFKCVPLEGHGGVAGLVIVPLWGFGGNHGVEFWPRVRTDELEDGIRQFDRSFRYLRNAAARPLNLPSEDDASQTALTKRFSTRTDAFSSLLSRLLDDSSHAYYYEDIKRMKDCVAKLAAAQVLPPEAPTTPTTPMSPADSCKEGVANGGLERGYTLRQKLKYLEDLWLEYDLLIDTDPISRHNVLVGPLVGVSITDKLGDLLYGAGLEVGWRQWFRATLSGGLRSSMRGEAKYLNLDAIGWWFGIGLSGQLGDQLVDSISGVQRIIAGATGSNP